MVIHNARQRMIRLPIGSWNDKVDPDQVIKEVVRDCQTFVENNILQLSLLSKKHKRIFKGLQNNAPEPTRSSKRHK